MSIYIRECSICKEKFRINGEFSIRFAMNEHIKNSHTEQYKELSELRFNVTKAKEEVNNYERLLGF